MVAKKRLLSILVAMLMVFVMMPMEAQATGDIYRYYTDDTGIKWIYTLDEEGFAEVIGNNDSSRQELTVPPVMDGHRVLYIGSGALTSHSWVTAINLPKDIVSIGDVAFGSCTSLQSITIPESVTSIGNDAFNRCTSLTSITIPDSVTSIGISAFQYCKSLESANLGSGITSIPPMAFSECTSLASITIPGNVTSIGNSAFFHCDNLESVTIPDSVTSIGNSAFYDCSKLKYLFLPGSVTTIGDDLIYDNSNNSGIVYGPENPAAEAYFEQYTFWTYKRLGADCLTYTKNNGTCTITGCDSHVLCPSFPIPAQIDGCTVTEIAANAFKDCKGIKGIEIPGTVTSIGDSALSGCTGLTALTIPESVKSIGNSAFAGCNGLTSLQLGSGVTSIGNSAFQNCSGLSTVSLPENVKNIGDAVFSGCTGLGSITIPDSVESIGASAFSGCTGLGTITIPNKVTAIGANTFSGCTGLVSASLPDGITGIGEAAFKDCSGLMSIALPDTVTSIGNSAFEGCESLTTVTIPAGVTAMGSSVFKDCAGMETVVLPKCTAIGDNAFSGIANGAVLYYPGTNAEWESVTKGTDVVPASCTVRTYDDQTETVVVDVSGLESGDQLILTDGLGTRREITASGSYGVWPEDTKLTVKAGEGRRYEGTLTYQQADGSMAFVSQISSVGSPNVELALNKGTPCVSLTFDNGGTRSYRLIVNEQILDNLGTSPSWKIKSGEQEYHNGDVLYTGSGETAMLKNFTLELTKPEGYTCEGGLYGAKNGSCIVKITDETTYSFNNTSIQNEDVILSLVWYETGARHTATVDGGSGSGKYRKDDIVTITAAAPADGKAFDQWTGTDGVSFFDDAASAMTTFTMPDADVTVTANYKDMDTVAAPTFDPAGGTYYTAQSVALSSATEGATIYYTTDRTVPTINSRKYTEAIRVSETTTIKAIAVKKDMNDSEVTEAVYTITEEPTYSLIVGAPPFDAVADGYTQPDAKAITIKNTGNSVATISNVTLSGDGQSAFLLNKTTGTTIEAGATDNTTYTIQPKGELTAGTYTAVVAVAYDNEAVECAAVSFTVNSSEQVATPTFSPEAGEVTSGTEITISCETEGATILYDIDGSNDPSTEYTGPIRITEATTISAIAIREDMPPSDVVTATYTIQAPVTNTYTVTFKAAGGTWTDGTTEDKQVSVEKGKAATAPEEPERGGYTFNGWDTDFNSVTSDLTVTAKWTENPTPPQPTESFMVTFKAGGGTWTDGTTEDKQVSVEKGKAATAPEEPERDGFTFNGWDTDFNSVTSDLTVTATWKENTVSPQPTEPTEEEKAAAEARETLSSTIVDAKKIEKGSYTNESWNALQAAIADADKVAANGNATSAELKAAADKVTAAKAALKAKEEQKPDDPKPTEPTEEEKAAAAARETLSSTLTDAKNVAQGNFTDDSWNALQAAIKEADALANDKNATAEQLRAAASKVAAAKAALKAKEEKPAEPTAEEKAAAAARETLSSTIADVQKIEKGNYTDESYQALQAAIAEAEKVAANDKATAAELNAAADKVAAAKAALKDKAEEKGADGTAFGKGASAEAAEKAITSRKNDNDPKGSAFAPLMLKSTKQGKTNINLTWKKATGAKKYVIYGNACGKKTKFVKITTTNKLTYNVKKINKKALKKATYHKFIVVALDSKGKVVTTSKVIHVATKGKGNPTKVKVSSKVKKNKLSLKKGKTVKLAGKAVGKKVTQHVKVRYESSNPKIASVDKNGKVKGLKKGKCKIYAYAQNGVCTTISVSVKVK